MKNYFTINELKKSTTAKLHKINNEPSPLIISRLNKLISFLNPIREEWGSAIKVNSGYRCPELNKLVGGSKTSSHMDGWAVDLWPVNGKFNNFVKFLKEYLKDKNFDQFIIESNEFSKWVHLSLYNKAGLQRKQIFNIQK